MRAYGRNHGKAWFNMNENKKDLIESMVLRMINSESKEWGMNFNHFDLGIRFKRA